MNKTGLVELIASKTSGISKTDVTSVVNALFEAIVESLSKGEAVTIVGFGTFNVADRAARSGRNPQTGQSIEIAARKMPRFSAGKALKDACNK